MESDDLLYDADDECYCSDPYIPLSSVRIEEDNHNKYNSCFSWNMIKRWFFC